MTIPKPTLSFKNLLIFILLGVIVILYFKQCGKKAPSQSLANETEKKEIIDKAQIVLEKVTDSLTKAISKRDDKIDSAEGEAEVYRYERNEAYKAIQVNKDMVKILSAKVMKEGGKDFQDCLDLAAKADSQSRKIEQQEVITVKLLDNLNLISKTKDSIIGDERRIKDAALKQGQAVATAYSGLFAEYKKLQPYTQVFIGGDGDINPMQAQVGGAMGFLNKRGTFYIAKTGITTNAQYYVGGTVLFRISFRKNN